MNRFLVIGLSVAGGAALSYGLYVIALGLAIAVLSPLLEEWFVDWRRRRTIAKEKEQFSIENGA